MFLSIRNLAFATALSAALVPAAIAGGASARVEGPSKDGLFYTVRTYACANPAALHVTAWAEGVVAGKRRTLPLTLKRTRDQGVYYFQRNWPAQGQWLVRLDLGGGRAPTSLATIATDGRVQDNKLIWDGDAKRECEALLAGNESH